MKSEKNSSTKSIQEPIVFLEKVVAVEGIRFTVQSFFYQTDSATLRNLDKPFPLID